MKSKHQLTRLSLAITVSATSLLAAQTSQAQSASTVQLYGQVGAVVSWVNHQGASDGHRVQVEDNVLNASYWGVKGTEDMGGGMKAYFRLESALNPDTGTNGARAWARQSYVGLDLNPNVSVTLGRQFNSVVDRMVSTLDVYNVAGASVQAVPLAIMGTNYFSGSFDSRVDNSVKLRLRSDSGWQASATAGAGEGTSTKEISGDVTHISKDHAVTAFYARYDAARPIAATGVTPQQSFWGLGGQQLLGPVRLYLTYLDNTIEAARVGGVTQHDRIGTLGAAWQVTLQTTLKTAYYYDKVTSLNGVNGRNGSKATWVVSGEYYLSKRTSLIAALTDNRYNDGYKLDPTNIALTNRNAQADSLQQVSIGMRHVF